MYIDNNYCETIIGNSLDIDVDSSNCEIRADVIIEKTCPSVRLWGQIKDCDGCPVANALVKLVRVISYKGSCKFEGVAHTISDCDGFYQFDLCSDKCDATYKIIVSKPIIGKEAVIKSHGNCDVCEEHYNSWNHHDSYCNCGQCDCYVPCDHYKGHPNMNKYSGDYK
jgi:hypothetical protein